MGTPDFAKESLEAVYNAGYEILGVVTNPDKPKRKRNEDDGFPSKKNLL